MASRTDHLNRCIELAEEALNAGDAPFGSVLVDADGKVLREARNRVNTHDATDHPEIELARWAAQNMTPEARRAATVYTSGEHCPMCSAAHGWAGLGRIVFIHSTGQLTEWMAEFGAEKGPVTQLGIDKIAPGIETEGPIPELAAKMRALHARAQGVTP
ncbi:nucleoside deaminase [Roseovarius nanhaiticus]|uniref:nucleoside deaminase n=1 Tax=Roseovarius nanhaiticus TaxID=573024 RepID=UPI00248FF4DD|nr:nucleoside deaminase [Roseovarius nanhaiticus]